MKAILWGGAVFVSCTTAFNVNTRTPWINPLVQSSFPRAPTSSWKLHSSVEDDPEITNEDFAGYQDRVRVMHDAWNALLWQAELSVLQEQDVNMIPIAQHLLLCQPLLGDDLYTTSPLRCSETSLELSPVPFQPPPPVTEVEGPWLFPIEVDDQVVLDTTKRWVQAMIADFAVCPFTIQAERAGIPRGDVRYTVSRATTLLEAFQVRGGCTDADTDADTDTHYTDTQRTIRTKVAYSSSYVW